MWWNFVAIPEAGQIELSLCLSEPQGCHSAQNGRSHMAILDTSAGELIVVSIVCQGCHCGYQFQYVERQPQNVSKSL
jgi:hypothetical protein